MLQPAEEKEQLLLNTEYQETMVESTFMYLTLDLPTAPLYKDEKEQLIIPQVPLFNILAKFNGITEKVRPALPASSHWGHPSWLVPLGSQELQARGGGDHQVS